MIVYALSYAARKAGRVLRTTRRSVASANATPSRHAAALVSWWIWLAQVFSHEGQPWRSREKCQASNPAAISTIGCSPIFWMLLIGSERTLGSRNTG